MLGLNDLLGSTRATVGIAICVSSDGRFQRHIGIVHTDGLYSPQLVHLAWHACLVQESVDALEEHYAWIPLHLEPERVEAVAMTCRRVLRRPETIPYGVLYDGGFFTRNGVLELGGEAVGLTCATFVLAVLKGAGIDLLLFKDWPAREDDAAWHAGIVEALKTTMVRHPKRITPEHITAVELERGCARYRPEEVAGAAQTAPPFPVPFNLAEAAGHRILAGMLLARTLATVLQ